MAAKPVAPPAAPGGADVAAQTVRSYIDALKRGDPNTAGTYLGNGTPDEEFIDENTRIVSVSSARNNDGSYRVRVTMQAAKGTYYETFVVSPVSDGGRILEKSTVKP